MAKPVWQQKLQEKLDNRPLFWILDPTTKLNKKIKHEGCMSPSSDIKGKRVSLREVVNYSFNTCCVCKVTVR